MRACNLASLVFALRALALPLVFLDNCRDVRRSLFNNALCALGPLNFFPVDKVARSLIPRSMPTEPCCLRSCGSILHSTLIAAYQRSAFLEMVTDLICHWKRNFSFNRTQPILGSFIL